MTIRSYEVVDTGSENLIFEVNGEWVFRLPRDRSLGAKDRKQVRFLSSFSKSAPLAVPDPVYVTDDFVGYRKIAGSPLYPTQIELLPWYAKQEIAQQLGVFLATLHHYQDETIDFGSGYLGAGVDPSCTQVFAEDLGARATRKLEAKLQAIAANPANYVAPTTIIHGDLYFSNILWDQKNWVVTGVVDWSSMGRGLPAMDFIALADFTDNRNDQFLRQILRCYGAEASLFNTRYRGQLQQRGPLSGQGERHSRRTELVLVVRSQKGSKGRSKNSCATKADTESVGQEIGSSPHRFSTEECLGSLQCCSSLPPPNERCY